jgi:hypothetical protein
MGCILVRENKISVGVTVANIHLESVYTHVNVSCI